MATVVTLQNIGSGITLDLVNKRIKVQPSSDTNNRIGTGSDGSLFVPKQTFAQSRWHSSDYLQSGAATHYPFNTTAVSAGTFNAALPIDLTSTGNNGAIFTKSSATANSGVVSATTMPLTSAAGLCYRSVFQMRTSVASRTHYIGFHDSGTSALPVDGAYLKILAGVASFETATNSVRSTSPSVTLSIDTWYTVDILFKTTTSVRCTVMTSTGVVVLDATISTNIPPAANTTRSFFVGVTSTCSAASASDLLLLDYQGYGLTAPEWFSLS